MTEDEINKRILGDKLAIDWDKVSERMRTLMEEGRTRPVRPVEPSLRGDWPLYRDSPRLERGDVANVTYTPPPSTLWTDSRRWDWNDPPRTTMLSTYRFRSEEERFPPIKLPSGKVLTFEYATSIASPSARWVLDNAIYWYYLPVNVSEYGLLLEVTASRRYSRWTGSGLIEYSTNSRINARLLWVKDKSQPKEYLLSVKPDVGTAKEAAASTWSMPSHLFNPSQHT